jgi:hypothetical protein
MDPGKVINESFAHLNARKKYSIIVLLAQHIASLLTLDNGAVNNFYSIGLL